MFLFWYSEEAHEEKSNLFWLYFVYDNQKFTQPGARSEHVRELTSRTASVQSMFARLKVSSRPPFGLFFVPQHNECHMWLKHTWTFSFLSKVPVTEAFLCKSVPSPTILPARYHLTQGCPNFFFFAKRARFGEVKNMCGTMNHFTPVFFVWKKIILV